MHVVLWYMSSVRVWKASKFYLWHKPTEHRSKKAEVSRASSGHRRRPYLFFHRPAHSPSSLSMHNPSIDELQACRSSCRLIVWCSDEMSVCTDAFQNCVVFSGKKLWGFWWPSIIDMEMNNYVDALLLFFWKKNKMPCLHIHI